MRRIHNTRKSSNPIVFDSQRIYKQGDAGTNPIKPGGFWYAIDNAWIQWCKSEEMDWIGEYFYEVNLGESNILMINSMAELLEFSKKFKTKDDRVTLFHHGYVDWKRVAELYDGVEIPNYIWECRLRLEPFWYYGWDCASGCVWNVKDIKLTLIDMLESFAQ